MASSRKLLYDRSATAGNISDRRRFAMALRLVTAIAEERKRWLFAGALMLLITAVAPVGPAVAEDSAETFSATVKVDATADNAAAARELARVDGQRRALAAVPDRLSS